MEKILVTGATGLLGSTLCQYLKRQGAEVIGIGLRHKADMQANLVDSYEAMRVLDSVKPDIVINLAALTNVDECERFPNNAYLLNVRIVENLVRWHADNSNAFLIQASTDQVYGGIGPHKEDQIQILNTYAFSKYCAEKVCERIGSAVLRINFFGKSLVEQRRSFSDWILESIRRKESLHLFTDVFFSPLSIMTLQEMIYRVCVQKKSGTFNLGSRGGLSKRDFAYGLAEAYGKELWRPVATLSSNSKLAAPRPCDMRMASGVFEETFNVELPSTHEEIDRYRSSYPLEI